MKNRLTISTYTLAAAFALAFFSPAAAQTPTPAESTIAPDKQIEILTLENRALKLKLERLEKEKKALGPFLKLAQYAKLVFDIQAQVAVIRDIPAGEPVRPVVLDKPGLVKLLDGLLEAELKSPKFAGQYRALTLMELIPEGSDLKSLYGKLLEGQVGGLYDDKTKSLYVVDVVNPDGFLGKIILAHEICHAMQDRKYDIASLPFRTDNSDQNLAMAAILEGDATLLMSEWAVQNGSALAMKDLTGVFEQQMEDLNKTPPFLVQSLMFPYLAGLKYCVAMQAERIPDWRNRLFSHPPTSTEQILHPEKAMFAEVDNPKPAPLGMLPAKSTFTETYRDTMGEWGTRLFLTPPSKFPKISALSVDPLVAEPVSTKAAAGWGGDTQVLIESEGEFALVWRTEWDTPEDCTEFREAVIARSLSMTRLGGAPTRAVEVSGKKSVYTATNGARLVLTQIGDRGLVWTLASSKRAAAEAELLVPKK